MGLKIFGTINTLISILWPVGVGAVGRVGEERDFGTGCRKM